MQNNAIFLRFGDLTIAVTGWVPPIREDSFVPPFLTNAQTHDIEINIYHDSHYAPPSDVIPIPGDNVHKIYRCQHELLTECRTFDPAATWIYAVAHHPYAQPDKIRLQILNPQCKLDIDNVISDVMMESVFLAHANAIFHAATIDRNGSAILFTAPSGTGKSTQAELWRKYRGTEIINGDKILLHFKNNHLFASGLPYAGTSGISKNRTLPVAAIVALQQAPENQIRRVRPLEATKLLVSEICLQSWNHADITHALDLVERVIATTPVYHLACLPDESAVQCLELALK